MRNFLLTKRKFIVFGVFVLAIIYIVVRAARQQPDQGEVNLSPTPIQQASFRTITPGKTSEDEMKEKLGNPANTTQKEAFKVYEYKGTNPNWNNEFYLTEQKVVFIKQITSTRDNINVQNITNNYGEPKGVLYGDLAEVGFYLYVYPEQGLAYLGNREGGGAITELWYFSPTATVEDFRKQYAPEYNDKKEKAPQLIDRAPDG
jgi:hypothetical protein